MPKKITFNDILQNKIKDFVGTKRWSNSQFASRYSDTYAEVYGKMEAPSTSTSRKLIFYAIITRIFYNKKQNNGEK